jgi:hypothetical protein
VFQIKAKILNLAIQHGHVYKRWRKIINATIEKIPGKPLIHKLRVIHLIESDFNAMIGILWGRRLMQQGEKNGNFGVEQRGSRKHMDAIGLVVAKQARFSVARLSRTNIASFDNDVKSCFDRIVMLVASLRAQREGMTPKACEIFLKTLDRVKYHVKTQLGISEAWYGTTSERTVHGPGQGGRGLPAIWVTISAMIMECLKEKSDRLTQYSTGGGAIGQTWTSGFVDDVTLWIGEMLKSLQEQDSPEQLLQDTAEAAQWWESLLYATGGKLELSKCFFYLVFWVFNDEGKPRMLKPEEWPQNVEVVDSATGESMRIETKDCNESHKTLGVMEAPNGDYLDETRRLKKKANEFARRASVIAILRQEAKMMYFSMIQPSMQYSAPAGTLTLKETTTMNSILTQANLSNVGYNRNTPLSVAYGPKNLGGIGMSDLFVEQGTAKTAMILKQVRANKELGRLIRCQYQWAQRVAGTEKQILMDPKTRIPQLDGEVGIQTLREFLRISDLGIEIPSIATPNHKRVGDRVLMTALAESGATDLVIQRANQCRLYLRVETLADVANKEGDAILQSAMDWEPRGRQTAMSDALWPKQTRPGEIYRKAWKDTLKMFCKDRSINCITNWASGQISPWQGTGKHTTATSGTKR